MIVSINSKSIGDKPILGRISLELQRGSITSIMGPSGIGKTTLLRIIAGLDQDDSGTRQPDLKIGMMFQEPHLLPWKTVVENIELAGPDSGHLAALGLRDATAMYPRQLSLGMARRVAFARALASKPDLLILDEPFTSLDAALVDTLRQIIIEFCKTLRTPILLTSHNPQDAIALGARIFTLEGTPAQLRSISRHD